MPSPTQNIAVWTIYKMDNSGSCTVLPASGTIEGAASITVRLAGDFTTIQSYGGSDYHIAATNTYYTKRLLAQAISAGSTPIQVLMNGTQTADAEGIYTSFGTQLYGVGPSGRPRLYNPDGSGNYVGLDATATAALTATLPNNSGTVAELNLAQTWTANQTFGGMAAALSTKSSNYTLTSSDAWINVTGTTTITLPHAIVGQRWVVFNSGAGTVTVQADSGNVNGGANITLAANTGKEATCDGTNCFAH